MKFFLKLLILTCILSTIILYDFTEKSCDGKNKQQSPIKIVSKNTVYSESNNFRVLTNDFKPIQPTDQWAYFEKEKAIGVIPSTQNGDFGGMLLVKNWSIYNFILKKILFRLDNENIIDNISETNIEMQMIFDLNANYFSPGKRKFLDTNKLVISTYFRKTADKDISRLFEFMNLQEFANNPTRKVGMKRDIKLHHIIVHQPAFMYKGTLTYPDCEDALWIINRDYHYISTNDSALLSKAYKYFDSNNTKNVRNTQQLLTSTKIYRNFDDTNLLESKKNKLSYNNAERYKVSFMIILLIFLFMI